MSHDDLALDHFHTQDDEACAPIWAYLQMLRELIEQKSDPSAKDREELRNAILRHLRPLGLYREIKYPRAAAGNALDNTLDSAELWREAHVSIAL